MSDQLPDLGPLLATLEAQEGQLVSIIDKATRQLAQVRQAKAALAGADDDEPIAFEGKLADAIRTILMGRERSFVPTELRDAVKALGYAFKPGSNEMAAVHGILKRLKESGQVKTKEFRNHPGVTRYFWAAPRTVTIEVPTGSISVTGTLPMAALQAAAEQNAYKPALHIETDKKK
jgi:hypothetical protein